MICKRCNKIINKKDKSVLLKTFEGKNTLEEIYFHWKCYLDWINESIENKAKKIYSKTIEKIIPHAKTMVDKMLFNNEETNENNIQKVWVS